MIDHDLHVGMAADQRDALIEASGDVQIERQRQPRGLRQHPIESGVGGIFGQAAEKLLICFILPSRIVRATPIVGNSPNVDRA